MGSAYLLMILVGVASMVVAWRFKSRFAEYSKIPMANGMTGRDVAEKMLRDNAIYDVQIVQGEGALTDHYDPSKKIVNLSPEVYNGRSIASAAVAAHECGHAVQHAKAYAWLSLRSALVPVVSFSGNIVPWILLGGIFTINIFPQLLMVGVLLFAVTTLFSFITLPVEFDASHRALQWLDMTRVLPPDEHKLAKKALNMAASTYVIAAVSSLATLLYYVSLLMGSRRSN
jgi:Zn-dependent membrane protease YugP